MAKKIENLKGSSNDITQQNKSLEQMKVIKIELKQKVKYYKDKYLSALKMMESEKKDVRKTDNVEEKISAQREVNSSQNCTVSEKTRRMEGSIKERFESMSEQYKIIRKFTNWGTNKKKTRKV